MIRVIQISILLVLFSHSAISQEVNTIVKDPKTGNEMIVGEVTRAELVQLSTWSSEEYKFTDEYNIYIPDTTFINYIKKHNTELPDVFIVLGTWCGDSKDQIPHFFKIMDLAGYPTDKIFMVAVDRDKMGGSYCLVDFNITLVPTFIFTRDGEEIGRIIETPLTTIEEDIVNIIKEKL